MLDKRGKKNLNVCIIGLLKDANIGDPIICDSVEYLCKEVAPNNRYKVIDLRGRCNKNSLFYVLNFPLKVLNTILYRFRGKSLKPTLPYRIYFKNFLRKELKNVDFIIFAGGGLIECEHYNCDEYLKLITEYAERRNILIAYNSVGFNGKFDKNKQGYNNLVQVLNSPKVTSVTVRENLSEMNDFYLMNTKAKLVCDSGVWSSDCYDVKKDHESDLIGVGLIRPEIFSEFDKAITTDIVIKYYVDIIKKLNEKKLKWQLFTNGSKDDYNFGIFLLKQLKLPINNNIVPIPLTGKQFLIDLSKYKIIICSRMHASICSYSLGIPSLALYWNPKQRYFYENIGYSNRCFSILSTQPEDLVNELENCMQEGYDLEKNQSYRMTIKESLNEILFV